MCKKMGTGNLTSEDLKYAFTDPETGKVIEGELVEETVIDGEDYIVMKYDDYYEARNVKDSSLIFYEEHDESESLGAEGDAEKAATAEEKQTSGKETERGHTDNKENNDQQDELRPDNHETSLGRWTIYQTDDDHYETLYIQEVDGQIEIGYSDITPHGTRISDMDGFTEFSSDGVAEYEFDAVWYGNEGKITITLLTDGIEVHKSLKKRYPDKSTGEFYEKVK